MSRPLGDYPFVHDTRSGVYRITNLNNGAVYVGSAKNFYIRWRKHLNELRKGIHSNQHFLRAWQKYGEASFKWEVVEVVPVDLLLQAEQRWLDRTFKSTKASLIYNVCRIAGSNKGRSWSPETRKKMSEAAKRRGNTCPHDQIWREKVSKANRLNASERCTPEMRKKISVIKQGNTYIKGLVWAHDSTRSYRIKPDDLRLLDGTLELGR